MLVNLHPGLIVVMIIVVLIFVICGIFGKVKKV